MIVMPMKHSNQSTFDSNESLQFDYAGLVLPRSPAVFYVNITYETAALN